MTRTGAPEHEVPRSIGRALDLLEVVLESAPPTLTEAADAVGLTPTTALRHLRALEARGYVRRSAAGRFTPGPTMLRLAVALHHESTLDRVLRFAQPRLDALAASTGESAYLALGDGRTATYVAMADSDRAIRHVGSIGQEVTLTGSAVGAALADVGTVQWRRDAVQPDITALSLAVEPIDGLDLAVSVIGPSHRLDDDAIATCGALLRSEVATLLAELGVEPGRRAIDEHDEHDEHEERCG